MDELHGDRSRQRLRTNRSQRIFRLFGWLLGGAILCGEAPYGLAQLTRTRSGQPTTQKPGGMPGLRTTTDAHNCYPYDGRWNDRIDRALATGLPVAIEQDLNWYVPSGGGSPRIVVGHGGPLTGAEPELEHYFFDRIRPVVEAALKNPDHSQWPVITLNLDFKTEEPEHLRAVRALLERYHAWLSSAPRTADDRVQPMHVGPVLVLNGPSEIQQKVFYDEVPIGGQLLTFGAARTDMRQVTAAPSIIESEPASNYRRWWNNPWSVVEAEGQPRTGAWTAASQKRLHDLVEHAHQQGLWIRFYTLDGATEEQQKQNGWFHQYNFPSYAAAAERWHAAIESGVDYLASDQYEDVGRLVRSVRTDTAHGSRP